MEQARANMILRTRFGNERGAVLLLVIVLSAIALAVMAAVLYVVTVGTQISGAGKRYRTALEAAYGSLPVAAQILSKRDIILGGADPSSYLIAGASWSPSLTSCQAIASGVTYSGISAKLAAPMSAWSAACAKSSNIDPKTPSTYDLSWTAGVAPLTYRIYVALYSTNVGNTKNLYANVVTDFGVVDTKGVSESETVYTHYGLSVSAVSEANPNDRARLMAIHQY